MTRTTHTYALLPVSAGAYDEIAAKLRAADYGHCFNRDGEIDMKGLALVRWPPADESKCAGPCRGNPVGTSCCYAECPVPLEADGANVITAPGTALPVTSVQSSFVGGRGGVGRYVPTN